MQDESPPDHPSPRAAGQHCTESNFALTLRGSHP